MSNLFNRVSALHLDSHGDAETANAKLRGFLADQAEWAAGILKQLSAGEAAGSMDKMQPAVLNSCEALSFINARKGGLGVTYAAGYGFVIKKLAQDQHGNSQWSAPMFFRVSQAGMGLSAGYQHTQSVIALLAAGAIDVFKKGTTSMGTDLALFSTDGALTGMSGGAAMGHSQHLGMTVAAEKSAFCYSLVDGLYLELSLHGSSITPDSSTNHKLYGDGVTEDEVLQKQGLSVVADFLPLYRTINELGRKAAGTS